MCRNSPDCEAFSWPRRVSAKSHQDCYMKRTWDSAEAISYAGWATIQVKGCVQAFNQTSVGQRWIDEALKANAVDNTKEKAQDEAESLENAVGKAWVTEALNSKKVKGDQTNIVEQWIAEA